MAENTQLRGIMFRFDGKIRILGGIKVKSTELIRIDVELSQEHAESRHLISIISCSNPMYVTIFLVNSEKRKK
ncbi:hypothetical protein COJ85_17810 [Bacillus sp. AFS076308]|nr:hypothetical protein COJ85_17810 [Bacillus sp. AFS076308]PGV55859.1 hypothetical protein COD92_01030 [Bacillus sp. AFS037270]